LLQKIASCPALLGVDSSFKTDSNMQLIMALRNSTGTQNVMQLTHD